MNCDIFFHVFFTKPTQCWSSSSFSFSTSFATQFMYVRMQKSNFYPALFEIQNFRLSIYELRGTIYEEYRHRGSFALQTPLNILRGCPTSLTCPFQTTEKIIIVLEFRILRAASTLRCSNKPLDLLILVNFERKLSSSLHERFFGKPRNYASSIESGDNRRLRIAYDCQSWTRTWSIHIIRWGRYRELFAPEIRLCTMLDARRWDGGWLSSTGGCWGRSNVVFINSSSPDEVTVSAIVPESRRSRIPER